MMKEKPMTREEFIQKGVLRGVIPPRFRLPGKWRMGLPRAFRILQWFYPRDLSPRTGVFEFLNDPYEVLCQRVFIWQQGSPVITCMPRPPCLPPPTPPAREEVSNRKEDAAAAAAQKQPLSVDSAQKQALDIAQKQPLSVDEAQKQPLETAQKQPLGAAQRPSVDTVRKQSVDSGYPSSTSVTNCLKAYRYLFADVRVECKPRYSVLTYTYTSDLRPQKKQQSDTRRPWLCDYTPTTPQDDIQITSPHRSKDCRSVDPSFQHVSKTATPDARQEIVTTGDDTSYDFPSSPHACLPVEVPQIPRHCLISEPSNCQVIGQGAFGSVSLATYQLPYPRTVAIKTFIKGQTRLDEVLMEARILYLLNTTDFLPEFYGVTPSSEAPGIALVQEYFSQGTTLFTVINSPPMKSADTWLYICLQLAVGLREIHRRGVLINDIKEDNVLVDSNFIIKYIDFGFATYKKGCVHQIDEDAFDRYPHIAPEARRGQSTTRASDIFSLGAMLETIMAEGMIHTMWAVVSSCLEEMPGRRPEIGELISELRAIRECLDDDIEDDT